MRTKGPTKVKLNLSITEGTAERLRQYAYENHTTVSQAVTNWIWSQKVKGANLPGQTKIGGADHE